MHISITNTRKNRFVSYLKVPYPFIDLPKLVSPSFLISLTAWKVCILLTKLQYDKATFSVYPQVSCLITMLLIKNSHPLQLINIFGKRLVLLWQHCDLCTINHWWHCPRCSLHLILHLLSVVGEEATGGAPHPVHLLGVRGIPGIWYYVDWDPIKSWNIHNQIHIS